MKQTVLIMWMFLLVAGEAFGAQGQREFTLAGAISLLELDDFCEVGELDCDDTLVQSLVAGSYGYHLRDKVVILGAVVLLSQDFDGDSIWTTVLQPTVKYYFGNPDEEQIRVYGRGAVSLILVEADYQDDFGDDDDGGGSDIGFGIGLGVERSFDGPFVFVEIRYDKYGSFSNFSIPVGVGIRF